MNQPSTSKMAVLHKFRTCDKVSIKKMFKKTKIKTAKAVLISKGITMFFI